jgi:starch-binding outer membrane protein SusE/F
MLLQLEPRRTYSLEARVTSSIGNSVKLVSNKVTFTARPFPPPPKVATPVNSEIWLVGGASPGGWNNPLGAPFITNQKFTRRSTTKYDLVVNLNANDGYLILPVMGSWSTKYCLEDGVDRGSTTAGGDFVLKGGGGQDFLSPTPGGTFKISLDFQLGKFTVVRQ